MVRSARPVLLPGDGDLDMSLSLLSAAPADVCAARRGALSDASQDKLSRDWIYFAVLHPLSEVPESVFNRNLAQDRGFWHGDFPCPDNLIPRT
jgi:hypothetical protein